MEEQKASIGSIRVETSSTGKGEQEVLILIDRWSGKTFNVLIESDKSARLLGGGTIKEMLLKLQLVPQMKSGLEISGGSEYQGITEESGTLAQSREAVEAEKIAKDQPREEKAVSEQRPTKEDFINAQKWHDEQSRANGEKTFDEMRAENKKRSDENEKWIAEQRKRNYQPI